MVDAWHHQSKSSYDWKQTWKVYVDFQPQSSDKGPLHIRCRLRLGYLSETQSIAPIARATVTVGTACANPSQVARPARALIAWLGPGSWPGWAQTFGWSISYDLNYDVIVHMDYSQPANPWAWFCCAQLPRDKVHIILWFLSAL